MAAIFHGILTVNGSAGNWVALPALPTGLDPMRRVYFRGDAVIEVGYGNEGQSAANLQTMCVGATGATANGGRTIGVVDYSRLVARAQGGSIANLYVFSCAPSDEPMKGF